MIVRDFRYIIKRIIIGVGIALALMFIKGNFLIVANAQVVSYKLYDVDYNLLYENNGTYAYDGDLSPVRYARVVFNDVLINNHSYSLSTQFGLTSSLDYAWIYWNGSSGVNLNGSYVITSPTSASTSSQQQIGSSSFYKQTNLMFDFVPSSNISNDWFLQLDFGTGRNIRFFDLLNYTLIDGGVNTNQDIINQTNNIINNQNINNQNVINNQNQNTQDIINNQNQNTQDIINNQNENSDKQIKSQEVCNFIDNNSIVLSNSFLDADGSIGSNSQYGITDYIPIQQSRIIPTTVVSSSFRYACFYNINKTLISCISLNNMVVDSELTIPDNSSYFRSSIQKNNNRPTFNICTAGNQALNNAINSDDVSSANSKASSFFNDFTVNNHGLSGIITSPLRLISSLSSSSCSSLSLPLPFVNQSVVLPCMSTIYSQHFSTFLTLYRLITDGVISYWVLIKIFGHIKGMQSPDDDRIEVLDL